MKYRPDIDGLRAIAILFVLLFHAGLKGFSSGFIGVDIFFVISGFLITGLIHNSLQNNHFSFVEFYSRRLWRMQPVFICLVVVCTLFTLFFFLPEDLLVFANSVHKSSFFVSNIFFEKILGNYFAPNSLQLPLLHTWSLSIEWQCYFILPIAIYLLHRFFSQAIIVKIIYGLTVLFFALSLYLSSNHLTSTYFQMPCRIFEFLIGSCIALSPALFPRNKYFLNILSFIALFLLVYLATRNDLGSGYPNYYALILCLATATLIAAGEHQPRPFFSRLLSIKPLVFIGLISYSLYIWHWPVLAFLRYFYIEETYLILVLAFIIIFILSWLSWRFIEKPARKLHSTKFSYSLFCLLIVPLTLSSIGNQIIKKEKGYPERFPNFARIQKQLTHYESEKRIACLQQKDLAVTVDKECILGEQGISSRRGFMIGDSFSNHNWRFMERLAKDSNLTILAHSFAACLTLPDIFQYNWSVIGEVYQSCHDQAEIYYNMIRKNHYDYVFIAQHWNGYLARGEIIYNLSDKRSSQLTKKRIEEALDKAIQIIIASGSKPVIIKAIALNEQAYICYYKYIRRRANPKLCDFTLQPKEQQWFDQLFAKMKKKYSELIVIDPKKAQCPNGTCKVAIDGIPVFHDPGHLTDFASYQLGELYLQQFKNPLTKG